ncbi:hypothetical protein [Deinococcus sp. QL22]|uniref:hypothetical protein n=1 Tax=Deinococcus sp. QL22 TaxID=2939437 RepID=UPI002017000F|nr:hypothetical protein [Deinococcus sp. QL22]UQN08116.1 hypothetical protein M1R55_18695 [Deinococcus sp. QL22]
MTQVCMTLDSEPTALSPILYLLIRKQCAVTYLHAQSEGLTLPFPFVQGHDLTAEEVQGLKIGSGKSSRWLDPMRASPSTTGLRMVME